MGTGERLVLSDVYPALLRHYRQVYRSSSLSMRARAAMPANTWVRSSLQDCHLSSVTMSLRDPIDLGLRPGVLLPEDTAEPSSVGYKSPTLPGIDEDLSLAGFLATWLCTFVLPLRVRSVRCSVLLAASQLSQGQRFSLAPPVLTRIYKCPQYFLERGYSTVTQLIQASSTLESERVRLFFFAPHLAIDHFSVVHQPNTVDLPSYLRGQIVLDGLDGQGRCTLLQNRSTLRVAEYFASMRPGWLCYRSGNTMTLEGYQPNRVALQFGFSQATPYDGRSLIPGVANTRRMDTVPLDAQFYAAFAVWLHMLRFGSGSTFRIALPHRRHDDVYTTAEHATPTSRIRDDRGRHDDVHTTVEHATPPVRVRDIGPDLHRTETPRSSRRHSGTRYTEPSRVSVDQIASPVLEHFLSPDEVPLGPRMSMDVPYLFRGSREDTHGPRMSDFTGYSAPDPFIEFIFQVDPYESFWPREMFEAGSFWPGESSGAGIASPTEPSNVPSYTPTVLDLVPVPAAPYPEVRPGDPVSYHPETRPSDFISSYPETHPSDFASSFSMPAGADYISEIHCHVLVAPDPWHGDMYDHCISFLQDLIARVDPRSPDFMGQFTSTANHTLGLLAQLGLEASEMQYWETLCRETKFRIRRLQSLSVLRTRASLPEL
ncbi:hypothetical protein M5K25_012867 [Dendrobium thyrsiflorum]|uniref:Aminotransferase-like plant mobile domain-containing protein n=1 Tax=Dendrobium thyrsiflorum TaxID=117978 RepID=A0ABD0UXZ8_DENTH